MRIVYILFILSAIVFPFGQLLSVTILQYPEVRALLLDVFVGLTIIIWLYSYMFKQSFSEGKNILIFITAAIISILANIKNYKSYQIFIGSLYLIRFVSYAGLYFVVKDLVKKTKLSYSKIENILIGVGVVSGIFGLVQYIFYPNLRNLQYLGWDPHYYRAFGTFFDPQFLGIVLVLTLILLMRQIIQILTDKTDNYRIRIVSLVSVITVFITLLLTYSRSSYFALVGGLAVIHKRKFFKLALGSLAVLLLLATFLKPKGIGGNMLRKETAIARIRSWKEAVKIWEERPIFGVGFNMLRYARDNDKKIKASSFISHAGAGVDNSLLFVLATTGVVGLSVYLNMFRWLVQKRRFRVKSVILPITTAVFIHSMFNNTLFYPHILWWIWVFYSSSEE